MEDLLDLYHQPYDPAFPVVCVDESNKQLLGQLHEPLPVRPGAVAREDHQYARNGLQHLFLASEPLAGRRVVRVTDRRTKRDFAQFLRALLEDHYPDATRIRIVLDNLNTHTLGAFYEAFAPEEARPLVERVEFHFTPKHGSWLNVAESELSVLARQCLAGRIPDAATLRSEVAAWETTRNAADSAVDWRFTTADARIKLKRLYPSFDE